VAARARHVPDVPRSRRRRRAGVAGRLAAAVVWH
jgi:hypothetical protein